MLVGAKKEKKKKKKKTEQSRERENEGEKGRKEGKMKPEAHFGSVVMPCQASESNGLKDKEMQLEW